MVKCQESPIGKHEWSHLYLQMNVPQGTEHNSEKDLFSAAQ